MSARLFYLAATNHRAAAEAALFAQVVKGCLS